MAVIQDNSPVNACNRSSVTSEETTSSSLYIAVDTRYSMLTTITMYFGSYRSITCLHYHKNEQLLFTGDHLSMIGSYLVRVYTSHIYFTVDVRK